MNHTFSISSLFLILFLTIFHCVQSANDIIEDTCKKLVANNIELNFDFCVKSLGSDSESHEANLEGLGLIGLKLFQANFTGTTEYIKQLVKQKLEPPLLKALSLCLDLYASVEDKDLTPFYKAKRYADVNTWVSAMKANADVCDKQYTRKGGMVPPLTKRNADVEHLSAIVLEAAKPLSKAIMASLAVGENCLDYDPPMVGRVTKALAQDHCDLISNQRGRDGLSGEGHW